MTNPITRSELVAYLSGGPLDPETRRRIELERATEGSPVRRWFDEMDAKLADPFRTDWGELALGDIGAAAANADRSATADTTEPAAAQGRGDLAGPADRASQSSNPSVAPPRRRVRLLQSLGITAGIAACTALATYVTMRGGPRSDGLTLAHADLVVLAADERGDPVEVARDANGIARLRPGADFNVRVKASRAGTATVVLATETGCLVYPKPGQDPVHVPPDGAEYGPLPPPRTDTAVIVVVAADAPRRDIVASVFPTPGVPLDQVPFAIEKLRLELERTGSPWAEVGVRFVGPAIPGK